MAPAVSLTRFALGTVAASGDTAETNTRAKYPRRGRPRPVTGGKGPRATIVALSPVSKTGATAIGSLDQLPYELAVGFTKYAHLTDAWLTPAPIMIVASVATGGIQRIGLRRAEDKNCSNSASFHAAP
jgi:hypothetical protein